MCLALGPKRIWTEAMGERLPLWQARLQLTGSMGAGCEPSIGRAATTPGRIMPAAVRRTAVAMGGGTSSTVLVVCTRFSPKVRSFVHRTASSVPEPPLMKHLCSTARREVFVCGAGQIVVHLMHRMRYPSSRLAACNALLMPCGACGFCS